jgi:hypothetical protein
MVNSRNPKSMETSRSIKAVKLASENHSINPIAPLNLDSTSPTSAVLWDNAVVLAMLADPTKQMNTERISEALRWLERTVTSEIEYSTIETDYRAKAALYRVLSERFLSLVAANQSNPEVARQFLQLAKDSDERTEYCRDMAERYMKRSVDQLKDVHHKIVIANCKKREQSYNELRAELKEYEEFEIS